MKLSKAALTTLADITKGISLPYYGSLFLFFVQLLPGLRIHTIRALMRSVQVECSADNLAGIIFVLKNKDIIRIYKKNDECYPIKKLPLEKAKQWVKEPLISPIIKQSQASVTKILNSPTPEKALYLPIPQLLRLMVLTEYNLSDLWNIIDKTEKIYPELAGFRSDVPPSTHQKINFFEYITQKHFTSIQELPEELHSIYKPSLYRHNALKHLPQYLTDAEIKNYTPQMHDVKDNISDVALHIAMHTGKWELFEQFTNLQTTCYRPKTRVSPYDYRFPRFTTDLAAIAEVLKSWLKGKWTALKKLKDIFHFNPNYQGPCSADCDLPLRAFLAPLILMMRLKIPNTQMAHVQQARYALQEFYGDEATALINNFIQPLDIEAKDYHLISWQYTQPIDLLPKALHLPMLNAMPELSPQELDEMCQACQSLQESGLSLYAWYMANALLCVPALSPQQTAELENILRSRTDLPLFCNIEKKTGIYDELLDSMQNILKANESPASGQQDGFISWRLSYNEKNKTVSYIHPYAHKKRKNGGYTNGKRISLAYLLNGDYDTYTAAKDMEIAHLIHKLDSASMWGIYYKVSPSLTQLLVGHPHIMLRLNNTEDIPIELTSAPPTLEIKHENGILKLKLQQGSSYDGVPIHHIEGNKYAVLTLNDKAKQLQQFIHRNAATDKTLTIPEHYEDRILGILSGFTDSVAIKGAVTGRKAKSLKSEPKLVIFLTPDNGSLRGNLMLELYPGIAPVPFYSTGKILYAQLQGKAVSISRSQSAEQALIEQARKACPNLFDATDDTGELQLELSDTMLHVIEELQNCDSKILETRWQEGKAISISAMNDFSAFNIKTASTANNWLSIGGEVQVNEQLVLQLSVLLQNINKSTGRYIELTDGHFLKLSKNIEEQLRVLSVLTDTPTKGKKASKNVAISPALMLLLAQSDNDHTLPDALRTKAAQLQQQFNTNFYKPRNINAQLRDYQSDGYQWMQRLMNCGLGACLADDMGLGKTLQVLCVLMARAADGPSLVIAPASVCNNWSTEAAKFTPTLNVYQLENGNREEIIKNLNKRDILVCSYGLLITESELLTSHKWNVVVLDEAQYIKNSQTQRARTACDLKAKCRIAATGTPIENSLDELWSIFEFINPGYLGSQEQFRERFANNPSRRKLLRRIVAPFVLRRLKGDVLDELPEKTETTRSITLNTQERALYEACRREALLKAQDTTDRFTILAQLMRLRRLCCHPQLIDAQWKADAGKLTALVELASELKGSGHKALIFSQFTDMLSLVRKEFDKQGFSYLYLDGSTPKTKRGKLVDAFQDGEADFFLISLKAGGTGLNLTAADYVILLDPWWNPAVESQAADRTHRIGQKRPVTVCRFVCKDTIEERVMALHAEKRELFDQVINDTGKATPLSIAELRELM